MHKVTNHARGIMAEGLSMKFLEDRRYNILKQRYKTKFGEVDIIAQKANTLCFIEVKMRKNIADALESITQRLQRRVEKSALFFLSENPKYMKYDMRFDVIAITKLQANEQSEDFEVTHLDNAWEATSIY